MKALVRNVLVLGLLVGLAACASGSDTQRSPDQLPNGILKSHPGETS